MSTDDEISFHRRISAEIEQTGRWSYWVWISVGLASDEPVWRWSFASAERYAARAVRREQRRQGHQNRWRAEL